MEVIRDNEHWLAMREESDKLLLVVDAHKDWCGPCKIMEPTYKRIASEIDHSEKRIVFASANLKLDLEGLDDVPDCKPRFLLFRNKKNIAVVNGANAPLLERLIKQHCPELQEEDADS